MTPVVIVSVIGTSLVLVVIVVLLPQLLQGKVKVCVAIDIVVMTSVETETDAGRV